MRVAFLGVTAFITIACGITEATPDRAIGEYNLARVNGTPVPAVSGSTKYYDGVFKLNADKSFSQFLTQGLASGGMISGNGGFGIWTRSHSDSIALTLTNPSAGTFRVWTDGQLLRSGTFEYERKTTQ